MNKPKGFQTSIFNCELNSSFHSQENYLYNYPVDWDSGIYKEIG